MKIPTVISTAVPAPPCAWGAPGWAGACAGTHVWPFHRHSRSGETAGFHDAPSHHQKPSSENLVLGAAGGGELMAIEA